MRKAMEQKIRQRKIIRLQGYDYSQAGSYFITINCQNRIPRFGRIENGQMILNQNGQIAHDEWVKLSNRFPSLVKDVFQIMPDHIHGIITLTEIDASSRVSVSDIIGAYKSIVLVKCLEVYRMNNQIMGKFWHSRFHDRIIRDDRAYENISKYVIDNPIKWNKNQ
jgi:REP element-mobilizing transposase RayT